MNDNSKLVTFFTERIDWDKSERAALKEAATGWKYFSFAGWGLAIAGVISIIPLLALHDFVPLIVTVDRLTGNTSVNVGKQRIDIKDPEKEGMITADVARYVKAREGFTRGEAENNYSTVWYMSAESIRGAWDAEFKAELNPRALMVTMSATDQIKITNLSVSFLPSDPTDTKGFQTAQIRYDKERRKGSNPATTQRMISTLTYSYNTSNVPKKIEGLVINPFGFTVVNYRADKESEEKTISSNAVQQGIYGQGGR
ncbi:VirB8 protein (plasmid) [Janthinobacterium sp. HH102]|uniref:type IV secretion system protein n=1 Tax=Janthinobacterium sp. HH102 TaxID=1537274 RepID=UPI000893D1B1|nr:type IV secretion system protein [Janthinobacterium sp. HH102]QOU76438.1 VirB8 protein [Janthinobacterium sp. HH102]